MIEHFTVSKGGGGGYAVGLARGLSAAGHEVHVMANTCNVDEVFFHKVESSKRRGIKEVDFAEKAREILSRLELDASIGFCKVVGTGVLRPGGGVHRGWFERDLLADRSRFKRFFHKLSRNIQPRSARIFNLEKEVYSDDGLKVIAVSNMVAEDLKRFYSVPSDRISVTYNGVDAKRFDPSIRQTLGVKLREAWGVAQKKIILFSAHNFRLKGLGALVESLPFLKKMGLDFMVVVAGGGRPGRYLARAKTLGVGDSILFAGPVDNMPPMYSAADLLAHPTFYDPCANVCLEAMAAGVPVVTSIYNGSGELIRDGREGFVVQDPWDSECLAQRIAALLDDDKWAGHSRAARELAEQHGEEHNHKAIFQIIEASAGKD